jgi:hypothetical protein
LLFLETTNRIMSEYSEYQNHRREWQNPRQNHRQYSESQYYQDFDTRRPILGLPFDRWVTLAFFLVMVTIFMLGIRVIKEIHNMIVKQKVNPVFFASLIIICLVVYSLIKKDLELTRICDPNSFLESQCRDKHSPGYKTEIFFAILASGMMFISFFTKGHSIF